jgi:hypothetical protein
MLCDVESESLRQKVLPYAMDAPASSHSVRNSIEVFIDKRMDKTSLEARRSFSRSTPVRYLHR